MTYSYDHKLVFNTTSKVIEPCCREMDLSIINGVIYGSAVKGKVAGLILKTQDKPKKGFMFFTCPFCNARLERVDL